MLDFDVKSGLMFSNDELFSMLLTCRKDLFFLKLQNNNVAQNSGKNAKSEASLLRKIIAKILTCINDKKVKII